MDHDQGACLRCGEPGGDDRFCESCRSQLDLCSESGSREVADTGHAIYSSMQAGRAFGLEHAAGGGSHPAEPLKVDVDGSLTVGRTGAPFELEGASPGADERLHERAQPPREFARFEDVLAPATADADRALAAYRWADAAGDARGATNLGVLLEQRGDLEGAVAAYKRGDERGDINGSFNLGCLLDAMGDVAGAVAALQRADERGDAAGASNLGLLLERQGDLDGALAAYRRADERGDAYGAFNLGLLLAARGDLAGARGAYCRAAQRGDAEVRARAARAEADATPAPSEEHDVATAEVSATVAAAGVPVVEEGSPAAMSEVVSPDPGATRRQPMGHTSRRHWVAAASLLALLGLAALLARRGLRRSHQ